MSDVPRKSITLESLVDMFSQIEMRANWDMSKDMLWGYFFTHHEPGRLEQVGRLLSARGYRLVSIYISDKESPQEPDIYWLHVERVETHTPETLDARNDAFYRLANDHGLLSYDGMDVGPVTN